MANYSLNLVTDTGPSSTDNSSSQTTITGLMTPGLLATVMIDGVPSGQTVMAGGDGRITFDPDCGPGQHIVWVTQPDGSNAVLRLTSTAPYPASSFLTGLTNLLPSGPAWPRHIGSNLMSVLLPLVRTFARNAGRAIDLLGEAFPSSTRELLPEWENSLGILGSASESDQTRAAAVTAQLIGVTGPSIPSLERYALALGYVVSITEQSTLRPGISTIPCNVGGEYSPFTWIVTAPKSAQNSKLAQSLQMLAPAHTILGFVYV